MAAKTEHEADGCIFQWKIENVSHCWSKMGEGIASPVFIADAVEGTKWSLSLYPMGDEDENNVTLYLTREEDCSGPDETEVHFQLAFLSKDGSILKEETFDGCLFRKTDCDGSQDFEKIERVFVSERNVFLPDDTLTVQCTIWNIEETPVKPKHLYARTVFKVNRKSFIWRIDNFSTFKPRLEKKINGDLIDFYLCLNEGLHCEKELVISINFFDESMKYLLFKTSIVNSNGEKENYGYNKYFADDLRRGLLYVPTVEFIKKVKENKSRYLPKDVLSLHCEYVISAVTALHDFSGSQTIFPTLKTEVVETKNQPYTETEKSVNTSNLAHDLKSLYTDVILCDTELRTSTRNFPAHKNILSARSPVFRSMFSNDMKERNCGHVDIIDFDDDTIHRMLMFMYTDSLEDLQFESAYTLYTIADKYEIMSLKKGCSSFLKENFFPTNVFRVLVLADLHHDENLLSAAQDYILGQRKDIFCSQECKHFMNSHPKLAADVMFRKIFQE